MGSGLQWDDPPSRSSLEFFVQRMSEHTQVTSIEKLNSQVYILNRDSKEDVRAWVCDVYTLGVADYAAIRAADPTVNCVVTLSGYNEYTDQVKREGRADGVGIFKIGELMSALHKEGDEFVG